MVNWFIKRTNFDTYIKSTCIFIKPKAEGKVYLFMALMMYQCFSSGASKLLSPLTELKSQSFHGQEITIIVNLPVNFTVNPKLPPK